MTATDDYPKLRSLAQTNQLGVLDVGVEANLALKEIDRLRELRDFHLEVLDDVLPILVIRTNKDVIAKINSRWTLVRVEPEEPT